MRSLVETEEYLRYIAYRHMTLGSVMRSIRFDEGMSLSAMAKKLGTSLHTLQAVEDDGKDLDLGKVVHWANRLGCNACHFVRLCLQDQIRKAGLDYIVHVTPE